MNWRFTFPIVGIVLALMTQNGRAASLDGIWLRADGNARVQIAPCGTQVCATNLWIRDTSQGEEAGDRLVMTINAQSDGTYSGTAFDGKRSRTYAVTLRVGDRQLSTRGCILRGWLCRTVSWTRVR